MKYPWKTKVRCTITMISETRWFVRTEIERCPKVIVERVVSGHDCMWFRRRIIAATLRHDDVTTGAKTWPNQQVRRLRPPTQAEELESLIARSEQLCTQAQVAWYKYKDLLRLVEMKKAQIAGHLNTHGLSELKYMEEAVE